MLGRCDRRAACRVRRWRVDAVDETEWQFDAVHLAPVQRWLAQHADGTIRVAPAGTRSLFDTYLDTSDLRIHRAQRSLRLRRIGRRTEITLKTHAPAVAGVRSREEITERVPVPDVAALEPDGEVGWRVRALVGRRQLTELFEVRTRRQVFCCSTERCLLARWCWIGPWSTSVRGSSRHAYGGWRLRSRTPRTPSRAFVERLRQECGLQLATHTKFEAGFLARGLEAPLARDLGSTSFDLHSSTGELRSPCSGDSSSRCSRASRARDSGKTLRSSMACGWRRGGSARSLGSSNRRSRSGRAGSGRRSDGWVRSSARFRSRCGDRAASWGPEDASAVRRLGPWVR